MAGGCTFAAVPFASKGAREALNEKETWQRNMAAVLKPSVKHAAVEIRYTCCKCGEDGFA